MAYNKQSNVHTTGIDRTLGHKIEGVGGLKDMARSSTTDRPNRVAWILVLVLFLFSCGSSEVEKAKAFMDDGRYPQAIELLNKRIQFTPDDAEALFNLGICLLNTGNIASADQRFASAVKSKPEYTVQIGAEYQKAANAVLSDGDVNNAISRYNDAIKYNPELRDAIGDALTEKGKALADSGNRTQAIAIHKYAYSIFPSLGPELGRYYAQKAAESEQLADKATLLRAAADFDPSYQDAFNKVAGLVH